MRKVFLLTGFSNWGKTTLIKDLFGKSRFAIDKPHLYKGKPFCVIPQSNDDLGERGYISAHNKRISELQKHVNTTDYIFSAFCPTREPNNDSSRIISSIYQYDEVYLLLILHKWCGHAKLMVPDITSYLGAHRNVKIHTISSKTAGPSKLTELQNVIAALL
ncbi:hypothetical protein J6I75_08670 [Pseudidiomarina sp. 1APP75-27a]|uniref:hypothetical protein n=1 Tax=Pseudidiomarina terrestris TaxID=2820060 RepID=UPI002B05D912|nr:hypothetical protein [Pseudidiomarina sp. 1APP75-27a]MEA3588424.1 hypothetical protein [Pseudidiomarina sp. 1APP75-27a]